MRFARRLSFAIALTACRSPLAPEPLAVTLRPVALRTTAELEAWPRGPVIEGGANEIVVSGFVYVGCGEPAASATRTGTVVRLDITAVRADQMCIAIKPATVPYQAVLGALPPGTYRVEVTVAGRAGRAGQVVTVGP